ncbi:MAG: DUF2142 domain-containing protein, partial [Eubacterium sp.]
IIFAIINFSVKVDILYKFEILSFLGVFIIGSFLIVSFSKEWHNFVFLVILLFGSINCFITPILDSPDEQAHLARSEMTSRFNWVIEPEKGTADYEIVQSVSDLTQEIHKTKFETSLDDQPINFQNVTSRSLAANNPFFGYIMQAIGINIAKTFHLSVMWMMWLGRIGNVLLAAFISRYAIKTIPTFKMQLSMVACLPMAVYQAASLSIDATINSFALLCIAYFIRLFSMKEKSIGTKNILIFFILCLLTGISKVPYMALALLIIFIPLKKFKTKTIYAFTWISLSMCGIVAIVWFLYTMGLNTQIQATLGAVYESENNVSSMGQIQFIKHNLLPVIQMLIRTMVLRAPTFAQGLFTYGGLSYDVEGMYILFMMFWGAAVLMYPNNIKIPNSIRLGSFLTAIIIYIATSLALYLSWTGVGKFFIEGLQGRYFLPLLSLFPLIFSLDNHNKKVDFKVDLVFASVIIVFLSSMTLRTTFLYY